MTEASDETAAGPDRLVQVLRVVIAVSALAIAFGVGLLMGRSAGPSQPGDASVDAGFARDMSTHHTQAVLMAGFVRDNTDDATIALIAHDIESGQQFQLGVMQGWLDDWGLARAGQPPMTWMGHGGHVGPDGLMPGMATPTEIDKLQELEGKPLDVYFLQLMIRHHQGGLAMAREAADRAEEPYVRNLAGKMAAAQSGEIVSMERLLRERGGAPLPAPA